MKPKLYSSIIVGLLAVAAVMVLILRLLLAFSYLPETGGMSVNMMYGTLHLLKTGMLYINPELPPFSITQYMPLHYYIVRGLAKLFNAGDVHQLMILHRIVCLLFSVLYCFIVTWTIKKLF